MTTFPALIPSTRTYSAGEYPNTAHPLLSGSEIRVRHSNTVLGVRLRLTFVAVTSEDLLAVRNHYNGRRGGFLPFAIPDEILSGVETPADFTPAEHQWRYASRPRVVDVPIAGATPTNRHDLVVELETVPPENTIVAGARITVQSLLQAGSPDRGALISAFAYIESGLAAAVDEAYALGALLDADVTLQAGDATAESASSIDVSAITYTQSSVFPGNAAATNAGMTNGVFAETTQTGTNITAPAWVQMDLGDVFPVATIYVGTDFSNTLAGGWGTIYTEGAVIEHSMDASTWTSVATVGTFTTGIQTFSVSFNARYIRIRRGTNFISDYVCVTEFYATSA
jgi:hypothetical protein